MLGPSISDYTITKNTSTELKYSKCLYVNKKINVRMMKIGGESRRYSVRH
jgi:hypothetical protein